MANRGAGHRRLPPGVAAVLPRSARPAGGKGVLLELCPAPRPELPGSSPTGGLVDLAGHRTVREQPVWDSHWRISVLARYGVLRLSIDGQPVRQIGGVSGGAAAVRTAHLLRIRVLHDTRCAPDRLLVRSDPFPGAGAAGGTPPRMVGSWGLRGA